MDIPIPDPELLCRQAILTARGGDTRTGIQLAQRAWRLARADGQPRALMQALNAMALCQLTAGRNIEAASTAIDAFRLAEKLDDRLAAMHALTTLLGASNHMYDTLQATVPIAERALELVRNDGDLALIVRLHNTRGVSLGNLGRHDEGEAALEEALRLAPDADRTTPPSMISANLAHAAVLRARNQPDDAAGIAHATRRLEQARAIAELERSAEAQIRIWYCYGLFHRDRGQLADAEEALLRCIGEAVRMHHHTRSVDARLELAQVHVARDDLAAALSTLDKAWMEADIVRPSRHAQAVCAQLAALHAQAGNATETTRWQALAEREQASFDQERAVASRELASFWAELERYWLR